MWPFKKRHTEPPTVPTDTVIPLHSQDDTSFNRSVVLYLTLRFDNVLDCDKIRLALVRLMELGDWRKLGARLRLNVRRHFRNIVPADSILEKWKAGLSCACIIQ